MTWPTLVYDMALTTDPLATPTWAAFIARLDSISTQVGRDAPLSEFDGATASHGLDNSDRVLDPLHTAGAYYGNLKPRRRNRLRATLSGTTYDLYYGYLNGFAQQFSPPEVAISPLASGDALKILGGIDLPTSLFTQAVAALSPDHHWRLGDRQGAASAVDRIGDVDGAYRNGAAPGADPVLRYEPATSTDFTAGGKARVDLPLTEGLGPVHTVAALVRGTSNQALSYPVQMIFEERDPSNFLNQSIWLNDGDGTDATHYKVESLVAVSPDFSQVRSTVDVLDGEPHLVVVVYSATVHKIYVDGVDVTDPVASDPGLAVPSTVSDASIGNDAGFNDVAFNGQIQDVAIWRGTALSAGTIGGLWDAASAPLDGQTTGERVDWVLDEIGWPAGERNIDTGIVTLGPADLTSGGSVLDYCQLMARTEYGAFYVDHADEGKLRFEKKHHRLGATRSTTSQFTFTDDPAASAPAYRFEPGDLLYLYDEDQVFNDVTVSWVGGSVNEFDQASIDAHTRHTYSHDTVLRTAAEARSLASWILSKFKDPAVRVPSITLKPSADQTLWLPALSARVGDRVTIRHHPQTVGSAVTFACWIEGISHSLSDGVNQWDTTFALSSAEALSYWIVGVSELGTDTRLAA